MDEASTVVVDRTGAESGWHGHCRLVLGWFLSAAERYAGLIDDAIGGRFHSWAWPAGMEIADVAQRLAQLVVAQSAYPLARRSGRPGDDWPDTWPYGWPSARARNRSVSADALSRRVTAPRPDDLSARGSPFVRPSTGAPPLRR